MFRTKTEEADCSARQHVGENRRGLKPQNLNNVEIFWI
jgi:hypothetical protein